ncbi:MAG: type II toxin-antitoxin system HipA family toxin [Rhodanobacteraceae bacterium]
MSSHVDLIGVGIWGVNIGAVQFDKANNCYAFEYASQWVQQGIELSPLTMPLRAARRPFVFPRLSKETYQGLPGMLADALPDKFGNSLIDAWMAGHGVRKESITVLDRLAYMGRRGMGALQFLPPTGDQDTDPAPLQMKALVEKARRIIRGDVVHTDEAEEALAKLIRVGTSAGGARAKAVVGWNPATGEVVSGQFDVPDGFEHWLVKFDGMGNDAEIGSEESLGNGNEYGRIEYAYALMAAEAGIQMERCRLLEENGRAHFMTKRFDRAGNARIHMQSLCGLDHLDYNLTGTNAYEQLFDVIDRLKLDSAAKTEAFRRMTFNVMARNCDDHTKNHAFLLGRDGRWQLSPAYDVTFAHNSKGDWTYQHLMSVNRKFDNITRRDLLDVAERFNVPQAKIIIEKVADTVNAWSKFADKAGISNKRKRVIADKHRPELSGE